MPVISKISDGVKEFTKWSKSTIRNININGTDYHFANKTECKGSCEDAVPEPLIDLKVEGNSIQSILPQGYKPLEYVTSTDVQYIDTVYTPTQNTKIYCKFQLTSVGANYPFGVRESSQTNICYIAGGASNWNFRFGKTASYSLAPADTELHEIEMSLDGVVFDGNLLTTVTQEDFTCPGSLYLFALNNNGKAAYGDTKMFEFKIWDKGILIHHYIPCLRLSDNVAGLYDVIRDYFNTSRTSTALLSGEDYSKLPTQDNPIEIKSVGERTKNLFDIPDITGSTKDITINCYITSNIIPSCQESPTSIVNTSGVETSIWRLSYTRLDGTMQYTVDDTLRGKVKMQVVKATEDNPIVKIVYRGVYIKEGKYSGIQLEYGDTQTEYEPYGYKIPIQIQAKNLFDYSVLENAYYINNNNIIITYGNTQGWANMKPLNLKPLTTYTITLENKADIDLRTPSNVRLFRGITSQTTFITDETGNVCIKLFTPDTIYPYKVGRIQLEEGSSTTYPITHTIYLKEPLRKIYDNYKDVLYADYIDYKNKKVVRNTMKFTLDGSQYMYTNATVVEGYQTYHMLNSLYGLKGNTPVYSDKLIGNENWDVAESKEREQLSSATAVLTIRLSNSRNVEFSTAGIQAWLKENPIEVIHALASPTEETIDIPEILLEKGLNNITTATSVEANIQATYWKQI